MKERGLKLEMTEGISTGMIFSVVLFQDPSRTLLRRSAYAPASLGHFDRACLMKDRWPAQSSFYGQILRRER